MAGEFAARAGAAGFTLEDLIDRLRDLLPDSAQPRSTQSDSKQSRPAQRR
jgi:hypothetical protein